MSQVLIVTYELANPGQNQAHLIKLIKGYTSWARLGGDAYLILTDAAVSTVRDYLGSVMLPNDKLYVGVSPAPSAWMGMPEDVAKWIHANQR